MSCHFEFHIEIVAMKFHTSIDDVGFEDFKQKLNIQDAKSTFPYLTEPEMRKTLKFHPCWNRMWSLRSCSSSKMIEFFKDHLICLDKACSSNVNTCQRDKIYQDNTFYNVTLRTKTFSDKEIKHLESLRRHHALMLAYFKPKSIWEQKEDNLASQRHSTISDDVTLLKKRVSQLEKASKLKHSAYKPIDKYFKSHDWATEGTSSSSQDDSDLENFEYDLYKLVPTMHRQNLKTVPIFQHPRSIGNLKL